MAAATPITPATSSTTPPAVNDRLLQLSSAGTNHTAPPGIESGQANLSAMDSSSGSCFRPIIAAKVNVGHGKWVDTYCLVDTGSNRTVVTKAFCKKYGLKTRLEWMNVHAVGSVSSGWREIGQISLQSLADPNYSISNVEVFVVDDIPVSGAHIARQAHVDTYPHLQEVKMIDLPLDEVSVLLGTDLVQAFTPMDIRKPSSDGVVALHCPFGWALMGKDGQKNNSDWAAFASFQDKHWDRPSYEPQQNAFSTKVLPEKAGGRPLCEKPPQVGQSQPQPAMVGALFVEETSQENGVSSASLLTVGQNPTPLIMLLLLILSLLLPTLVSHASLKKTEFQRHHFGSFLSPGWNTVGARTYDVVIIQESLDLDIISSVLPPPSCWFDVRWFILELDLMIERKIAERKNVSSFPLLPFIQVSEKDLRLKAGESATCSPLLNVDRHSFKSLVDEASIRSERVAIASVELRSCAQPPSISVIHPSLPAPTLPFSEEPLPRPPNDADAFHRLPPTPPRNLLKQSPPRPPVCLFLPTPPGDLFKQPPPRPPALLAPKLRGFPRILALDGLGRSSPNLRPWKLPRCPPESSSSVSLVTSGLPTYPSSAFPTQTRILSATSLRIFGFIQGDPQGDRVSWQDGVLAHSVPRIQEVRRYNRGRGDPVGLLRLNFSPFSPVASKNGGSVVGGGGDGGGMKEVVFPLDSFYQRLNIVQIIVVVPI